MLVLGGGAVSFERGTPVCTPTEAVSEESQRTLRLMSELPLLTHSALPSHSHPRRGRDQERLGPLVLMTRTPLRPYRGTPHTRKRTGGWALF